MANAYLLLRAGGLNYAIKAGEPVSRPPTITSSPPETGEVGIGYSYQATAHDPDLETITWSLVAYPVGMTVSATGLIEWTPGPGQTGANAVTLRATDASDLYDEQEWDVTVTVDLDLPKLIFLDFDETGYVQIADAAALDLTGGALTIEAWILPQTYGQNEQGRIIDHGGGSSIASGWTFRVENAGYANCLNFMTNHVAHYSDQNVITVNAWQHVAVTLSAGTLTFYVNGVATGVRTSVATPKANTTPIRIGMRATDDYRGFHGYIDEVRIWSVARTAQQLIDSKDTEIDGATEGLVAYWRLNEGTGVTTADQTGDGHTGTLISITGEDGGLPSWRTSDGNRAPNITSTPVTTAIVGGLYSYQVVIDDDPGDTHTYRLITAPTTMEIDAVGEVSWVPAEGDAGSAQVIIEVEDSFGATAVQSYWIAVAEPTTNHPPVIWSQPVLTGTEGQLYSYQMVATDEDVGDTLTYSLPTYPAGMTIGSSTGLIQWTPGGTQAGAHAVEARVQDQHGLFVTQGFNIAIADAPVVDIPSFATWEAKMLTKGKVHGDKFLSEAYSPNNDTGLAATYYDALRVYEFIARYTGDPTYWHSVVVKVLACWREYYVLKNNGSVPGKWNFTHGLRYHYERTGDASSKQAAILLSRNASYARDSTPTTWTIPETRSREVAYALRSYLNAELLGEPRRSRLPLIFEHALGHLDIWNQHHLDDTLHLCGESESGGEYEGYAPFMFALTAEALMMYWSQVAADSRILDKISRNAAWTWTRCWVAADESMLYRYPTSTSGSTDLNLLIAPLYAWLYLRTGDTTHRDRGDALFAGGAKYGYMDGPKQFNQCYTYEDNYIVLRQEATG